MDKIDVTNIPTEVTRVTNILEDAGFEAYLVGGCVRDMLLNKKPKDWDVTTNAKPDEIIKVFGKDNTYYENNYGTVGVKIDSLLNNRDDVTHATADIDLDGIIEITPYRTEGSYSDARRPDEVAFSDSIHDDLQRRDFTINAMAFRIATNEMVDLYDGMQDLQHHLLKAVGNPNVRFGEDALRMMRAVRFAAQLNFVIENNTMSAITDNSTLLAKVSYERIGDELTQIIMSDNPAMALGMAEQLGLLKYIIPELRDGIGCEQGKKAHAYDVFEHNLRALQHAADKNLTLEERLASLLHDIGKPQSRRKKGSGYTFYGHEVIGARMAKEILQRLAYSKKIVDKVTKLVRWHMFFSDPDVVTLSAVRRMIMNVGEDSIQDLLRVRMCDRIGSGRPKEQPFRFRKYQSMVEEALRDPINVGMLKIDGNYLMQKYGERPGPRIGWVLHALLEDVLDNPDNNTIEYLDARAGELLTLSDSELRQKGESGKNKQKESDEMEIKKLRTKYNVY